MIGDKFKQLDLYIKSYADKDTTGIANDVVNSFNPGWKECTLYPEDRDEELGSKYGFALEIYSCGIFHLTNLQCSQVEKLENLVECYDKDPKVKYRAGIKESLYWNLGLCWHKLGVIYDVKAKESFKRSTLYMIAQSSETKYNPVGYQFRRCDKYLFKSLINEELNVSSPLTFNDPFDCPIKNLLNIENEYTKLLFEAYRDCLKIACFVNNVSLPYMTDDNMIISGKKKHDNDKEEFLNMLLWSHYADNHKGVCIKYNFPITVSKLIGESENQISYFKDVLYSDEILEKYTHEGKISLLDAYFLKGKAWEYENELRLLLFDVNGKDDYQQVPIPNCIEAVYFGLNCSETDKATIRKILKSKKLILRYRELKGKVLENIAEEYPIKFYQMQSDHEHFGQLIAKEI